MTCSQTMNREREREEDHRIVEFLSWKRFFYVTQFKILLQLKTVKLSESFGRYGGKCFIMHFHFYSKN
jgi:hypothetical protein